MAKHKKSLHHSAAVADDKMYKDVLNAHLSDSSGIHESYRDPRREPERRDFEIMQNYKR